MTTRDVLRLREFRLLFAGHGVSVLGDRMVAVALAFAVLELGGSASEVGLVLAAAWVPAVASVLVGGVVADRVSRQTVMVSADLLRVASQGTIAALLISGAAEIWMLAALAGVTGAGTGFFSPAATGLLPEVVPSEGLQPANALRSTAASVSEILGPVAAGLLVAAAGAGYAIAADAATFAISAACVAALHVAKVTDRKRSAFLSDLRDGWIAVRSRRWVLACIVFFAVANVMWAAWTALGPVVADRDLGGAGPWGTVLGAVGVGALLGSIVATRVRPSRPLVFVALMEALFVMPLAFLAAGASVPVLALGAALSRRRADARAVGMGDHAPARDPARIAVARGFVRLVRLVRRLPDRPRDLGAARRGHRHSHGALARLRPLRRRRGCASGRSGSPATPGARWGRDLCGIGSAG